MRKRLQMQVQTQMQMRYSMALKCQLGCCSLSWFLACKYPNCWLQIPISRPKSPACETDAASPFGWPTFMSISEANKALSPMRLSPSCCSQKNQPELVCKKQKHTTRLQHQLPSFSVGSLPAFKRLNIYTAKNVMLARWRSLLGAGGSGKTD